MNVLVCAAFHHYTGPAITALSEAMWLKRAGVDVKLAISLRPKGNLLKRVEDAGLEVLPLNLYRKHPDVMDSRADIRRLKKAIFEFDAVISHHSHDHWICTLARGKSKRPVIIREIHRSREVERRPFSRWIFRRTDGFIVVGAGFGKVLSSRFGIGGGRVLSAPLSVDTDKFRPDLDGSAFRERFGIPSGAPVVGIVSRIKPGRGHELVVRAAKVLSERLPTLRWALIGRGELQARTEQLVGGLGLEDNISIWGYVGDDLPFAICACDLMLLLSEPSEGGCRAAVESAACGRPTLAPRIGAIFDVFEPEQEAFVLERQDPHSLANRIEELLADRRRLREVGGRARAKVEDACSEPGRTERIKEYLEELISWDAEN